LIGDPVGSGFVATLARPGGNITGVSIVTSDLSAKLLGLFVQMIPGMRRVGLVGNSYNPNVMEQVRESEDAIRKLGLQSQTVEARTPEEFERGFANLKAANVDGVVLLSDPVVLEHSAYYVDRILKGTKPAKLPVEQPTQFDFVINAKTAKALGLTIPTSLLALADEVIE
jgi:putative tryptophan/tyrosine transport system substrate-binding protein